MQLAHMSNISSIDSFIWPRAITGTIPIVVKGASLQVCFYSHPFNLFIYLIFFLQYSKVH